MYIEEIRMKNYKQFVEETIVFNRERNILIGENGVGKTSILKAISYVLSAGEASIRKLSLQSLFNTRTIRQFMEGKKEYKNLPVLEIELFLSGDIMKFDINGVHNSKGKVLNGLKMMISRRRYQILWKKVTFSRLTFISFNSLRLVVNPITVTILTCVTL